MVRGPGIGIAADSSSWRYGDSDMMRTAEIRSILTTECSADSCSSTSPTPSWAAIRPSIQWPSTSTATSKPRSWARLIAIPIVYSIELMSGAPSRGAEGGAGPSVCPGPPGGYGRQRHIEDLGPRRGVSVPLEHVHVDVVAVLEDLAGLGAGTGGDVR